MNLNCEASGLEQRTRTAAERVRRPWGVRAVGDVLDNNFFFMVSVLVGSPLSVEFLFDFLKRRFAVLVKCVVPHDTPVVR